MREEKKLKNRGGIKMKKVIFSLVLIFGVTFSLNQSVFARGTVKKQIVAEQLSNQNKPSYFVQLRSWRGGILNIDMSVIVAMETMKTYDTGIFYNPELKNVNVFRDMFGNTHVSQEFSSQDEAEKELIKITKEYNDILIASYKGGK